MPGRGNTLTSDLQYTSGLLSANQLNGLVQGTNLNGGSGALDGYVFRGDLTWQPLPAYQNWTWVPASATFVRHIFYQGSGFSRDIGPASNQTSVCVVDEALNPSLVNVANPSETIIGSSTGAPAPARIQGYSHFSFSTTGGGLCTVRANLNPVVITEPPSPTLEMKWEHIYIVGSTTGDMYFALPTSAPAGSTIQIIGTGGTGNWYITQAAGQSVRLSSTVVSTEGVGGVVFSDTPTAYLWLMCIEANNKWVSLNQTINVSAA